MSRELARSIYETGRAHALSAVLLHYAAAKYALKKNVPDPDQFVFNGAYSLSIFYLIGLGLELFLKAAIVLHDENVDLKFLKYNIGHDLVEALDTAENKGFSSQAQNLREIATLMQKPYQQHHFRYVHPAEMQLPNIAQVIEMLAVLDKEFEAVFGLQN